MLDSAHLPPGCFYRPQNRKVFFNSAAGTASHARVRQSICFASHPPTLPPTNPPTAAPTYDAAAFQDTRGRNPGPNILFVLADDLGYGDVAAYGHPYAKTPSLDRLAAEGTRYTRVYVAAVTCCPSRVSLMAGRFPPRFSVMPGWVDVGSLHSNRPLQLPRRHPGTISSDFSVVTSFT